MRWDDDYGNGWRMHDGAWAGWGLMFFVLLLLVAITVIVVMLLVRSPRQTSVGDSRAGEAERILRRRFASGEIDEQEYLDKSATLREGSTG